MEKIYLVIINRFILLVPCDINERRENGSKLCINKIQLLKKNFVWKLCSQFSEKLFVIMNNLRLGINI